MKVKHMVEYLMPGAFFPEDTRRELPDRSIEAAVDQAPEGAYCFHLYDTPVVDFEFDAGLFEVVPIAQNESDRVYIGGEVFTCDELRALAVEEGDPDRYRTLIANVTHYESRDGAFVPVEGRAIRCAPGNWQEYNGERIVEPALAREDRS